MGDEKLEDLVDKMFQSFNPYCGPNMNLNVGDICVFTKEIKEKSRYYSNLNHRFVLLNKPDRYGDAEFLDLDLDPNNEEGFKETIVLASKKLRKVISEEIQ